MNGVRALLLGVQALVSAAPRNFQVTQVLAALATQRHHLARRPESATVFAEVLALIASTPGLKRLLHLKGRAAFCLIFGRKEDVGWLAYHLSG